MSLWRRILSGQRRDPIHQVLAQLLGTQDFEYDVLGILGLERRYEVRLGSRKLYLNVLAYGADCRSIIDDLQLRRDAGDAAPQVLAWTDREPLLNGHPYILSDRML